MRWVQRGESQLDRIKQDMPLFQGISCFAYFGSWRIGRNRRLFWNSVCGAAPPGGPQMRSGEPSTGWFPLSVCSPFRGERFAFLLAYGGLLARNAGRPPLSLRDISPAQRGNLPAPPPHREHSVQFTAVLIFAICVQAQPALLKKLEQNFYVLLSFGFVLTFGTNPYTRFHTGNRG